MPQEDGCCRRDRKECQFPYQQAFDGYAVVGCRGNLYTVGKLLGHTSFNSTQVYADVIMETKIEAVNRISEFFEYGKKQKRNTII